MCCDNFNFWPSQHTIYIHGNRFYKLTVCCVKKYLCFKPTFCLNVFVFVLHEGVNNISLLIFSVPFMILQLSVRASLVLSFFSPNLKRPNLFNVSSYGSCSLTLIIFVALLCTSSISNISFFNWDDQNCMQYSRCGHTMDLYSSIMIFLSYYLW